MGCYHPIKAHQSAPGAKLQLLPDTYKGNSNHHKANIAIPCGTCIGCKSARATHWAIRCEHEASNYDNNIFLTLTYAEKHLPPGGYHDSKQAFTADLQKFIKRLRKDISAHPRHYSRDPTRNTRYFACGEYGTTNGRPHYHAILFNVGFPDRYRVGGSEAKGILYGADRLAKLWPWGDSRFGDATGAAANYIAQYTLKKQGRGDHDDDGVYRPPPFVIMSKRPVIGARWLERYTQDLKKGYIVRDATPQAIPRAYLRYLKKHHPQLAEEIEWNKYNGRELGDRGTPERLKDAEIIHKRLKELTETRHL